MRKAVLKESSAGKELEIRIVDPALAHALVREPVNVLLKQKPDGKARRDSGPALVAIERCKLRIDPGPVDPYRKQNQRMVLIDDLIEPCPEQIAAPAVSCCLGRIASLRCSQGSRFRTLRIKIRKRKLLAPHS